MDVLVLGSNGRLGRLLRGYLSKYPDRKFRFRFAQRHGPPEPDSIVWKPGDPTDVLPECSAVLALWGAIPKPGAQLEKNSELAECAIELAGCLGAKTVLHCSSAAVYDRSDTALAETDSGLAFSDYGRSKLQMEKRITELSGTYPAVRSVMMRIGNVAGADSLFGNLAPGNTIRLDRFPDGKGPSRSYIAMPDLMDVFKALIEAPDFAGPINVAAPVATDMEAIVKSAGCRVEWRPAPEQAVRSVTLNTDTLAQLLPLTPETAEADHLVRNASFGGVWP